MNIRRVVGHNIAKHHLHVVEALRRQAPRAQSVERCTPDSH